MVLVKCVKIFRELKRIKNCLIKLSCQQGKDKQAYVLFYFYVIKGPAMVLGVKKDML